VREGRREEAWNCGIQGARLLRWEEENMKWRTSEEGKAVKPANHQREILPFAGI